MDIKEQMKKAYELFKTGDMETFFNDMIDDEIVWTFPGKEGVHPLSGAVSYTHLTLPTILLV